MAPAIPPPLPPSVEEAYRRKCLELKQRTNEVEKANDAARLRLIRIRHQVEKLRVERAMLLEQISRRTSTNVEDSEGSPSPPPTVRDDDGPSPSPSTSHVPQHPSLSLRPSGRQGRHISLSSARKNRLGSSGADRELQHQPKEKPLRTKRGHRKPSVIANLDSNAPGATFINQNVHTLSPSSDAFSHSHAEASQKDPSQRANGVAKPPKKPSNAFELYCKDARPALSKDEGSNAEEELARGWKDLAEEKKEEYQARHDKELAQYQKDKDAFEKKAKTETKPAGPAADFQAEDTPARDEDVYMANYDTEQEATPAVEAED